MAERELLVRILGDDRDLQRALGNTDRKLDNIDRRTQSFGRNVGKAFAVAGIAVGTAEIFRLAGDAVDAASDLNEQMARSQQIFDESAASVEAWSQTTASSIGVAQREALRFAGTFGLLFRNLDLDAAQAEEFSKQLVELAADMASFNNTDVDTALVALRSGLTGEVEPLRKFGVFLSEARSNMAALEETGKSSTAQLTTQEKVLARLGLVMQDTTRTQGDFQRTSDNLANQQRILRANFDDLSANLGNVLVPVLTDAAEAANLLFIALDKFRGVDFSPGFDFPDPPDWLRAGALAPISPLGAVALGVKRAVDDDTAEVAEVTESLNAQVQGAIGKLQAALDKRSDAIEKLNARDVERSKEGFDAFVKGMGLKLDKAQITASLSDDIAALRELERAINRRIAAEGKTFKLVSLLTQTRLQINDLVRTQAEDAQQAGVDAFNATVDALDLNLEMAEATQSFADDQAALRAIETAILNRIAAEGETTDLLRQLFNVRQQQAEVARQVAEQSRTRRKEQQFSELGLTEEGDRPTPGTGALRRRLGNLREQIKGTVLDTEKTRRELDAIAEVLSGKFGDVGKEVREAILRMFNDITGALDEGGKKGPLTKTSGLNTKKILAGLGLSDEEINELRGRLSSINSAGNQLVGLGPAPGGGRPTDSFGGAQGPILVESHTTINLDGQQVAKVVTKNQQKTKRRNPSQKRGPNRHR